MGFNCGIVGLPNVGKSTIFNALTSAGAQAANYPFCTIDPNVGVVEIPDPRMRRLTEIAKPQKVVPTTMEFVDIAGLVAGASQGEGLGNKFLGHIRSVDAIAHIVRCFEDPNVVHVSGSVDPKRDIEIIEAELALADLDTVDKRLQRSEKGARSGDKKLQEEVAFVKSVKDRLERGEPIRGIETNAEQAKVLQEMHLLTDKPVLYVANVNEDDVLTGNAHVETVRRIAAKEGAKVIIVCGKIEEEISTLPLEERGEFLESLGLKDSGLDQLIRAGYELLGLITYFTVGEKEVRAWTILKGMKAPQAAGVIHTDFERGFIRAEVISYEDFNRLGSEATVKEKGLLRVEGKDYVVQDGDCMHFRFNV
ncbi:MAG: redox-regulated ATPase YchF [Nitrospirota bacterium]|nr:redox-regulated ATPase YchF [Nitrospirota bacterium]